MKRGRENGISFYLGASASPHHRSLPPLWPWAGQRETVAPFRKTDSVPLSVDSTLFLQVRAKIQQQTLLFKPWNLHFNNSNTELRQFHHHHHHQKAKTDVISSQWKYSPLRIYWNSPWVQARRSYEGFHLQISSLIYCYQLCCPSERKQGVYGFQRALEDHSWTGPVCHHLFRHCRRN